MSFQWKDRWWINNADPNIGLVTDPASPALRSTFRVKQKKNGDWVLKGQRRMAWSPGQVALTDLQSAGSNVPLQKRFKAHFILDGKNHRLFLLSGTAQNPNAPNDLTVEVEELDKDGNPIGSGGAHAGR